MLHMICIFMVVYQNTTGLIAWVYETETMTDVGLGIALQLLYGVILVISLKNEPLMESPRIGNLTAILQIIHNPCLTWLQVSICILQIIHNPCLTWLQVSICFVKVIKSHWKKVFLRVEYPVARFKINLNFLALTNTNLRIYLSVDQLIEKIVLSVLLLVTYNGTSRADEPYRHVAALCPISRFRSPSLVIADVQPSLGVIARCI